MNKGFNLKDKIKNYGFWTSISAAVVMFLQMLGQLFGFGINEKIVSGIIMAICEILVVLGIVSNPTSTKGFMDEKKEDETKSLSLDKDREDKNN
ncbi:MAG: phage holin [Clostridia bacterium]